MSAETSTTGTAGSNGSAHTTSARDFILPDLGEGLTEAELISWLVDVGDEVHVDQMVVEVESAKSVVELPCPFAGRIEALHASAGDTVSAGQALLSVAEVGADLSADVNTDSGAGSDSGGANLIGYGTSEPKARSTKKRSFGAKTSGSTAAHAAEPPVSPPAAAPEPPVHAAAEPVVQTAREPAAEALVSPVSSPIVRKLAKDNGLSAKHLPGTGPGGIVTRADVLKAIESGTTTAVPNNAALESGDRVGTTTSAREESTNRDTRTPITGLRKVVSERLTQSRQEIPEATIWLDVDATELLDTKRALEARTGEKYSLLSLVSRFVIAGLKKYPIINSSIDTEASEIVTHGDINLGLAAQTPRGLMVPVVHGADQMSLRQLRDSVSETVGKASTGKFSSQELTGGTFTLNNYGVFGVDGSAPIINLPEVAMLGLGRIKDRPWVVDGELTVRKVMYLSFVFDHRACDGAEPSQFLTFIADCIENPISLLPEL
ncbi:MAG: 2-oxo acid dehydrogenase subunit E2 [Brevibacterium sp.]|uniref:dihydrolipoamide acetyltransferase family protein n=1 Tax=Brevibacterium sp. TaxID=1701 RepID=UPI0026491783|nr:dihydrolipoamide acetyltransferase family protein [Brevibacterium sp.]MDN5807486.1 2-oxo acid dehydrogenase subunit E2 [Brevibacterium sp.]MDN5833912.1 2-oxo acid dehydrogenase subunit E2 [Brevibacterium sp.]MDN5876538.1 2-oxo acid dehydrogenase subunit E2 [Brevibacterium sp.]MDN5909617.1 2-oxo acid dehydrogenase subunit E2 [Brevibacterium sp.]MDN6122404.1 2-oxo acid dehydrogenase subunit E2 [Brevibacterium sp.]